jgi:hypothetical protein
MGSELEPRLGLELESVPRLAARGWPGSGELGAVGTAAAVGTTRPAPTAMGARGQHHVEPNGPRVGILEQRHLADDLTDQPATTAISLPNRYGATSGRSSPLQNRPGSNQFVRFSVSIRPISW